MKTKDTKWHRPNSADGLKCKECKEVVDVGKPDPCLKGYIPNVAHACCGHGREKDAFVNGFDGCKPHGCVTDFDSPDYVSQFLVKNLPNGEHEIIFNPDYKPDDREKGMMPGYWKKEGKEAIEYMKPFKRK